MRRVQMLNGIHVLCHQTSARDFECSGPPSWSQTGENVENMRQVGYECCIYLIMFLQHCRHIIKYMMTYEADCCWKMTRNKTNLLCARAYKKRSKRKETSILSSEQEMNARFMVMTQSSQWKSHSPVIQESWGRWSQTSRACCLFSWTVGQFFKRSFFFTATPWFNSSA